MTEAKTFMIEDARIIFRNFKGEIGPYNQNGKRQFAVVLSPEDAERLAGDGWNVKLLQPREEGDEPTPYIPIEVSYKNRPPRVVLLTDTTRTNLDENSVEVLDWADVRTADLIARAYEWDVNGKQGIKAYLQSLFVTVEEDALERKYGISEHSQPTD